MATKTFLCDVQDKFCEEGKRFNFDVPQIKIQQQGDEDIREACKAAAADFFEKNIRYPQVEVTIEIQEEEDY